MLAKQGPEECLHPRFGFSPERDGRTSPQFWGDQGWRDMGGDLCSSPLPSLACSRYLHPRWCVSWLAALSPAGNLQRVRGAHWGTRATPRSCSASWTSVATPWPGPSSCTQKPPILPRHACALPESLRMGRVPGTGSHCPPTTPGTSPGAQRVNTVGPARRSHAGKRNQPGRLIPVQETANCQAPILRGGHHSPIHNSQLPRKRSQLWAGTRPALPVTPAPLCTSRGRGRCTR